MTFLEIQDFDGLCVDALAADKDGTLLFLSVWGRDSVVQELLGKLSLPPAEGGINGTTMTFFWPEEGPLPLALPKDDQLVKTTGRMPAESVYGDKVVHLWIYQLMLQNPDYANNRGFFLCLDNETPATRDDRLWRLLTEVCPVPLLDMWRVPIIKAFSEAGAITVTTALGMSAYEVELNNPEAVIKDLLRSGRLEHPDQGPEMGRVSVQTQVA